MQFEFDAGKSASNKAKHGIDFEEAQALWDDPFMLEAPARTTDEPRYLAIGRIGRRHWTAVFALRREVARIVSVRRPRLEEVSVYEG